MLFDIATLKDEAAAGAIAQAILARDPAAQITVQLANRRVKVQGGELSEDDVLQAISAAGHIAVEAPPHSGEGSTCCGGCGG
ncbi:copper chaperone [Solilutibacter oculi]|nr:copper chaperone [Lysobacter oculi]